MTKPYSNDLRERAIAAVVAGDTMRVVAEESDEAIWRSETHRDRQAPFLPCGCESGGKRGWVLAQQPSQKCAPALPATRASHGQIQKRQREICHTSPPPDG
jgi:hypothetical protein